MIVKGPSPVLAHFVSAAVSSWAVMGSLQERECCAAQTGSDACPSTNQLWPGGRIIADDDSSIKQVDGAKGR